jgi:hypothetical protein
MDSTQQLESLKAQIEKMPKTHQLEILKILNSSPDVKLNENKSGVYINLSFLPTDVIPKIQDYLVYVKDQENALRSIESQKQDYVKTYFENDEEYPVSTAM